MVFVATVSAQALMLTYTIPPLYERTRNRTPREFASSATVAYAIIFIFYMCFGWFGYVNY
eukprot:UN23134